jgi:hypothetical protein
VLEDVRIAKHCPASWVTMKGDDRVRFCGVCQLNVYNLSNMTRAGAEALISGAGGQRVCVRLYRRVDGTFLTQDCPVGVFAVLRRQARTAAVWFAVALGLSFLVTAVGRIRSRRGFWTQGQLTLMQ